MERLPRRTQRRTARGQELGINVAGSITHFQSPLIGLGWHLMWRTLHGDLQMEWRWDGVGGGWKKYDIYHFLLAANVGFF